jgi:hypothetical protein
LACSVASANPGDKIARFLDDIVKQRLPVELIHLSDGSVNVGVAPPNALYRDYTLEVAKGCCGDEVRKELKQVLRVLAQPVAPAFVPDYCVFYRNQNREVQILWFSTHSGNLQMRYYASDLTTDQCQIVPSTTGSDVCQRLLEIREVAKVPPKAAAESVKFMDATIDEFKLPCELMSIDPKPVDNVFGQKRWNVLGKVSITAADNDARNRVVSAIAIATAVPPEHTAHAFTPRLAIAVRIQRTACLREFERRVRSANKGEWQLIDRLLDTPTSGIVEAVLVLVSQQYVLLMSFECGLAELYVDGKSCGCCAISKGWSVQKVSDPRAGVGGLATDIAADQFLNNILVDAGKSLKPKATSSSN